MDKIFEDIKAEIARQNHLWGEQSHPGYKWCCILVEEIGELCQAILKEDILHAREEVIQVAAVAAQVAKAIDREIA